MEKVTPIGVTDWRNQHQLFGIKDKDRLQHIYVIGKSGTGKSTLLLNMAISDIQSGKGLAVIDPHGDLAEMLLDYIPEDRIEDVIYFNPKDYKYPIGFNPLANIPQEHCHLVVSGLLGTFKKVWGDSWGPRLEYILRFSLLTLLERGSATLLDIQPLLTDAQFRNEVLKDLSNYEVLLFWKNEFEKYTPAFRAEAISPILNKIGVFVSSAPLRNIVGQSNSSFSMQEVLDGRKILIANLSKGQLGEDIVSLLGSVLITAVQLAALFRSGLPENSRIPFYLYVDEMHSFISMSFADILAEARKYKLSLFLTHQYIEQIQEKIRYAIFGNVGTIISFRIGADDAIHVAREFHPVFDESDLVNLPQYSMYLKLLIDGTASKPFSAQSLPLSKEVHDNKDYVVNHSRNRYSRNKDVVENEIRERYIEEVVFKGSLFE